mmetsp:Transcript_14089/g.30589  ORF Transcript_14089/g.30589 Transcript_14089/m.30589 type:complete len:100 (-) Transcript_14089:133-432(-)
MPHSHSAGSCSRSSGWSGTLTRMRRIVKPLPPESFSSFKRTTSGWLSTKFLEAHWMEHNTVASILLHCSDYDNKVTSQKSTVSIITFLAQPLAAEETPR